MLEPISITAISSISSLGSNEATIWKQYLNNNHHFSVKNSNGVDTYIAELSKKEAIEIEDLKNSNKHYKDLDKSVLMAIFVARNAVKNANWKDGNFGINIGSSRGATELFEKHHRDFLKNQKTDTLASPTTTLGNISSWVAHDLQSSGPTISHSITCSTALHAVLNGIAWINSGMSDKFLVGGSEAPLTDFTIAQMKALKIYADCHSGTSTPLSVHKNRLPSEDETSQSEVEEGLLIAIKRNQRKGEARLLSGVEAFPCKTLDLTKRKNTMVLGEGAATLCLEKGRQENALAIIEGIGYATEILEHSISISDEAVCFQKSMHMALKNINLSEIDAIVMHAPGTLKGDTSEYNAIQIVFGNNMPALTSNKWKIGHTFGASGALSLELAILMLKHQEFIGIPFLKNQHSPKKLEKILVNAVGFGGNAVSILISNPN